jgi:hypothetical protein
MAKNKYHGWIVRVSQGEGFNPHWRCEWREGEERKARVFVRETEAIEFFDQRVGEPIKLMDTPLGAYRVYTEEQ